MKIKSVYDGKAMRRSKILLRKKLAKEGKPPLTL
jgi:hypothetical protein